MVDFLQPDIVLTGVAERYLASTVKNIDSPFPFVKFLSPNIFSNTPMSKHFYSAFEAFFASKSSAKYIDWLDKIDSEFFSNLINDVGILKLHNVMAYDYDNGSLSKTAASYAFRLFSNIDYMTQSNVITRHKNLSHNVDYRNKYFNIKTYSSKVPYKFNSYDDGYLHWLLKGRKLGVSYNSNLCFVLKIALKCKDEPELLEFWINYHASIVGLENLIIFDTGSTDQVHLDILDKFKDRVLIFNYDHHYNKLHNTLFNKLLFDNISLTCKYLTLLDADEFLNCLVGGFFLKNEVISLLKSSNQKVLCGVWLHNNSIPKINEQGIEDVLLNLDERNLRMGFIDGKAILKSDSLSELRHIGHNLHVKEVASAITNNSIGYIFIIHLSNLGEEIQRNRILKYLEAKGVTVGITPKQELEKFLHENKNNFDGKRRKYIDMYLKASNVIASAKHSERTNILNLKYSRCSQIILSQKIHDFDSVVNERIEYLNNK